MSKKERAVKQVEFCKELMARIAEDTMAADDRGRTIGNRCTIQADIVHLRRELMRLSRMLEPTGGWE